MEYMGGAFLTEESEEFLGVYEIGMAEGSFAIKPKECELSTFELTRRGEWGC
jgi:hypothetical protein